MMQVVCVVLCLVDLKLTNAAAYDPQGCSWDGSQKVVAGYDGTSTKKILMMLWHPLRLSVLLTGHGRRRMAVALLFSAVWLHFLHHSWYLRYHYEPPLCTSLLLNQSNSTVDDVFAQLSSPWHRLILLDRRFDEPTSTLMSALSFGASLHLQFLDMSLG
jgi:hypothetical protein